MVEMFTALARLKREPLADLPLGPDLDQAMAVRGHRWRDRLLPPLVTLRLFLIQILAGNCSIAQLRQLGGVDFALSSYSEARSRLPLDVLQWLLQWMQARAEESVGAVKKLGQRVLIADGSSYSMADTPELRAHFDLPAGTRPGVGYPAGKLMGLLDAATGLFVSLLALPLFMHDARGVLELHPMLRPGDILLGDRAFCSFCHLALLQARGVFACVRLHQRRKEKAGGVSRWKRPTKPPGWMDLIGLMLLPKCLDVRIVAYTIARKGYRTRRVLIATTLMDTTLWPDEKIAELYGQRWQIETCFDHLKTTMNMNVLRCTTVDGVTKELAMYLAAYNLVRLVMLEAAKRQGVSPDRISFVDAMRWTLARMLGLKGVRRLIVNPDRRGRSQLRVIRRRLKEYDLLTQPRREAEAELAAKQAVKD
jgi:Transposase DDE domain